MTNEWAILAAETEPMLDGLKAPWPMSLLEFLGLFVAIPVGFAVLVILLVYGASWTRSGRTSNGYTESPLWLSSPAASVDAPQRPGTQITSSAATVAREDSPGGSSARW
ncbi:MAG: hypothetical protein WAO41_07040 [Candidatus Nanopelagicales bacterium]